MEKVEVVEKPVLKVGIEEKVEPAKAFVFGLQHVLAMFGATVTVPLVVGGAVGLSGDQIAMMIQAVLLAMGIATLLQTIIGTRYPIVQGSSFAFIPGLISIGSTIGMAAVQGALIVGGLIEGLVGWLGIIGKIRKLFTPLVTGVTITLIGFSLANVALMNFFNAYADPNGTNVWKAVLVATVTFLTTVFVALKAKGSLKATPVVVGAAVGCLISIPLGLTNFSLIESLPILNVPKPFPWGAPVFDTAAIVILLFAFMVSIIESVGDYHAIATVTGAEITEKHIGRGIGAEGLACSIAGFLGACGTTSYSENIGVVALTKVGSRHVVQVGAVILIFLSLFPKFAGLLASMPAPVLGGLTLALYGMISVTGLRLIKEKVEFTDRNVLILAAALIAGLGAPQLPESLFHALPRIISSILESGMAVGAITAIILERIL
ncbi:uracil-xanthine permease family protein [Thermococcus peptonophilus]|uniref:Uracil permease n=2 Tax=Thermococcus peptonophilus TaxID=53952 RepID=A0A142CWW2_9EURY|nr:solute carrier family 23 protein [Thermococcus peptonophilus]AMQ19264.1 uracil permease [Thermococcus peptonophilus]